VLTRASYTDAHREAVDRIVRSVFEEAVAAISQGRRLPDGQVRGLVDAGPMGARQALDAGLVDALGYRDQAYDAIRERIGHPVGLLLAERWHPRRRPPALSHRARRHVAFVDVRGTIAPGRSHVSPMGRVAGSDTIGASLRAAARSDQVGAVLMRVDSPGGSAIASETIWREVVRTRESGTPVVVSMGELAASGGYYVACPADVIVALPSTLTGSIGVLGGKLVVAGLLDQLGLTTDRVRYGEHALMGSAREGFTEAERDLLDEELDRIYSDFVGKVAAGRRLSAEQVEAVARGRVWTGSDALRIGLVDELGNLRQAYRVAQVRGGLPPSAPLRPALHVATLRRLGRPRNTDDPRAGAPYGLPSLAAVAAGSGLTGGRIVVRNDLRLGS
jgi:protease-4